MLTYVVTASCPFGSVYAATVNVNIPISSHRSFENLDIRLSACFAANLTALKCDDRHMSKWAGCLLLLRFLVMPLISYAGYLGIQSLTLRDRKPIQHKLGRGLVVLEIFLAGPVQFLYFQNPFQFFLTFFSPRSPYDVNCTDIYSDAGHIWPGAASPIVRNPGYQKLQGATQLEL
jgi:hypothetical protein